MTLEGDADQSTKRQRQEEIPREFQPASSSCAAADTSMQIPDPEIPTPARQMSPAEREDSIPKRHRPAEVNTMLTTAGVYNGNEIASWTEDQKALHAAKQKQEELLNMDKFGCGRDGRQTAITTSSLDTLGTKTAAGRILKHANRGKRI